MTHATAIEMVLRYESAESEATFVGVVAGGEVRLSGDGDPEEIIGPVTALPLIIGPLVGLGPRPHPGERAPTLEFELDGPGRSAVNLAVPPDQRLGSALAGDWSLWSLMVMWEGPEGPVTDGMVVVDGGDEGLAMLTAGVAGVMLRPTTSSAVWSELCGILPYVSELADGSGKT